MRWANDPTDLMLESYPIEPKNWSRSLGIPKLDNAIPLAGRPDPITEDLEMALINVEAIEKVMLVEKVHTYKPSYLRRK
jgi:hypothetical protein